MRLVKASDRAWTVPAKPVIFWNILIDPQHVFQGEVILADEFDAFLTVLLLLIVIIIVIVIVSSGKIFPCFLVCIVVFMLSLLDTRAAC